MQDYIYTLLMTLGPLSLCYGSYAQEVDGSVIFATNCAACHTIGQGRLIGPDLKGVSEKHDKPWIARFIRESQAMIGEGDEKAVAVFNAYSMIPMPAMPLSDEQIDAVLAHIKKVGTGGPGPGPALVQKKITATAKTEKQIERPPPQRVSQGSKRWPNDGLIGGNGGIYCYGHRYLVGN